MNKNLKYDTSSVKLQYIPLKYDDPQKFKQDSGAKTDFLERAKVIENLIEETKKWHLLVKVDRTPFLEKLVSSKKLAILENHTSLEHIEKLLVEKLKKSIIYICTKCDIPFSYRQNLYKHNQFVHVGKVFTCQVCGRHFSRQSTLIDHRKNVHSHKESYTCAVCDLSLKSKKSCERHILTKHSGGLKTHSCDSCGKSFNRRDHMISHRRTHFKSGEGNVCHLCKKTFHLKITLTHHIMQVHTGERPYKCELCGKTFVQSSHYYQHKRDHSAEYFCEACNKYFSGKRSMLGHQLVHSVIRPFKCVTCGKTFKTKSLLESHMIMHQPKQFSCDICKRYFRLQDSLSNHRARHFKEFQFKCDLCNVPFKFKKALDRHYVRDHVVCKFKCKPCKKSFLHRSSLYKHNKETHFENNA